MPGVRIKLQERSRKIFFRKILKKLKYPNLRVLSSELCIPYSTIKKYSSGELLIPGNTFFRLCKLSSLMPDALDLEELPGNWGQRKGGKKGIETLMQKYKKELPLWREKAIKNSSGKRLKKIKIPQMSEKLAEFIGIHLGDGTMTKYFIRISGDYRYDLPYFRYISALIVELFGIKPQIFKDQRQMNTGYVLLRSKAICSLLNEKYNIPFGDKIRNKACIPNEILRNKKLSLACLRGLIDTDGSVSRRGTDGKQFCIDFKSHNPVLLSQVKQITEKTKLFTHFYNKSSGTNCWSSILKYFTTVGSSNLRHVVRFHQRTLGNTLYQKEVIGYYEQDLYKQLDLPFKGLVI